MLELLKMNIFLKKIPLIECILHPGPGNNNQTFITNNRIANYPKLTNSFFFNELNQSLTY